MRDLKAPLMIAVPAAITILGIAWFLRKLVDDKKDGKLTCCAKNVPPKDRSSLKNDKDKEASSTVKKEGITLTQRKIPETNGDSLTDSEREKVREIVEAAIGAGLKEAEDMKFGFMEETQVVDEEMVAEEVVEEEMKSASFSSLLESSMNNNMNSVPDVRGFNAHSKEVEVQKSNSLNQVNYIDNKAIADFFTQDQTTYDNGDSSLVPKKSSSEVISSSSANVVTASPCPPSHPVLPTNHGHSDDSTLSACNTVPLEQVSTITKQSDDGAVLTSSSTPSFSSSPYSLPSNTSDNISADSVLIDSSVLSDLKRENTLVTPSDALCSSSLEPSENSAPQNESVDSSQVAPDSSKDQQAVVKTEESSSSSSHNSTSPVCDNNSVGSSDSGRGGSEQDVTGHSDSLIHFDFNMPSELCGRLIGKKGYNINQLKAKSGANVSLTHNPLSAEFQICQVVGTQAEIDEALRLIRVKFPLDDYPHLTMTPVALSLPKQIEPAAPVIVPDNMQLSLPDGASVEVYVSTIVDAGHVFVQQPTHRTFMSLEKLNFFLNTVYSQDDSIPSLPQPIECGVICVCENEGSWYRAMVMTPEDEYGECQVKFVDYGGYTQLPISCIKQIRADFMNLPFQAVECFVANIAPLQGEEYFSTDSTMALSEMSQMKLLQCQVVARNEIGTPYIHLYVVSPETNTATMVNRALVNNGMVRWVEIL